MEFGPLPVAKPADSFVTYQDSCHLRNVQKVIQAPRQLLRQVAQERFIELPGASECCASGGIYNLLHFPESMKILDTKMKKVEALAATTIVTTNPGCQGSPLRSRLAALLNLVPFGSGSAPRPQACLMPDFECVMVLYLAFRAGEVIDSRARRPFF